jgi:hypothetical protein
MKWTKSENNLEAIEYKSKRERKNIVYVGGHFYLQNYLTLNE